MRGSLAIAAIFIATVCAQSSKPEFEAAAISPLPDAGPQFQIRGGPGSSDPELFDCAACSIGTLLRVAFDVQPFQISAPQWVATQTFQVRAKIPPNTTRDQFHAMLQNLLAERFKLAWHRETKEMGVLDLTVGKTGAKLKDSVAQDHDGPLAMPEVRVDKNGYPNTPRGCRGCMMVIDGKGRFTSEQTSMSEFATMLSLRLNKLVFDKTGLQGRFDIDVTYSRPSPSSDGSGELGLPLPDAIESQLGLKFESRKEQVEMIVVDHLEKIPTGN
jgi:uncharacterized protein (TIGR03435 family)